MTGIGFASVREGRTSLKGLKRMRDPAVTQKKEEAERIKMYNPGKLVAV